MYVSYRIGDQVSWTTKRLKIAPREVLITDGRYTARTRCGNLISLTPQKPIRPAEPDIQVFDVPKLPGSPGDPGPLAFYIPTPTAQPSPPTDSITPNHGVPPGDGPYPYVPILYFPAGGDYTAPTQSPAVSVPEPGTLILLSMGLFAVWGLRKRHRVWNARGALQRWHDLLRCIVALLLRAALDDGVEGVSSAMFGRCCEV